MASITTRAALKAGPAIPAAVWWACVNIAAIIGLSRTSFGLLLPAVKHELTGSYYLYGWVTSANFIGYLAGNLILPFVLPRIRDRAIMNAAAVACMAITLGAQGFAHDLLALAVWRLINGLAQALTLVLTISLALEAVDERQRGKVSGIVWTGAGFGIAIMGCVIALSAHAPSLSWRTITIASAITTIAVVVPGLLASTRAHSRTAAHGTSGEKHIQARPFLLVSATYGLFGVGFIVFFTYFSSFARAEGVDTQSLGLVWAGACGIGAFGGMIWGRIYDRIGEIAAPAASALAAAGALGVMSPIPLLRAIGALALCSSCFGIAALVSALLRKYTGAASFPRAFTIATIVFALGQLAAVPPAGALADRFGLGSTMLFTAAAFGLGAIVAYANARSTSPVPERTTAG